MSTNGVFTISLDFELHWGGFEKWPLANYRDYFLSTRQAIPEMLDLFEEYQVHVTWATVGMLFHHKKAELLKNAPLDKPSYLTQALSAYHHINAIGIGEDEENDPFHFAPSLIRTIHSTPYQEVGTHTYSHFYCNEPGQTIGQFKQDLKAAKRAAAGLGVNLRSLVFPRNQFNNSYLEVCAEEGITSVRSNPVDWFWKIEATQNESAWKRLSRGMDAYIPIGKLNSYSLDSLHANHGLPVCIPASRLLRPYRPQEGFLNHLKIWRIKSEMTRAAKLRQVYHLWWHPHNFGHYPHHSLVGLRSILEHFTFCRKKWQMKSLNMGEIADNIFNEKKQQTA